MVVKFGVLTVMASSIQTQKNLKKKKLKWLLGVNKYCNNNACRAETGRFSLRITAQCRTLKFWLTLAKHEENNCHKLSQVAYNDIKRIKGKISWSQKIKNFLYHIGLGILWEKAQLPDVGTVSIIRQRLEDIELQRWFSEMNNDIRKDPNQSNKMRTYRKVSKGVRITSTRSPTSDTEPP